jgi:hypothetical protein
MRRLILNRCYKSADIIIQAGAEFENGARCGFLHVLGHSTQG